MSTRQNKFTLRFPHIVCLSCVLKFNDTCKMPKDVNELIFIIFSYLRVGWCGDLYKFSKVGIQIGTL